MSPLGGHVGRGLPWDLSDEPGTAHAPPTLGRVPPCHPTRSGSTTHAPPHCQDPPTWPKPRPQDAGLAGVHLPHEQSPTPRAPPTQLSHARTVQDASPAQARATEPRSQLTAHAPPQGPARPRSSPPNGPGPRLALAPRRPAPAPSHRAQDPAHSARPRRRPRATPTGPRTLPSARALRHKAPPTAGAFLATGQVLCGAYPTPLRRPPPNWWLGGPRVTVSTAGMLTGKELTEKADGMVLGSPPSQQPPNPAWPESTEEGAKSSLVRSALLTKLALASSRGNFMALLGPDIAIFPDGRCNTEKLLRCCGTCARSAGRPRASLVR